MIPYNPHIKYYEGDRRGYFKATVTPKRMRLDLRFVTSVENPSGTGYTEGSWVVEDGQAGAGPGVVGPRCCIARRTIARSLHERHAVIIRAPYSAETSVCDDLHGRGQKNARRTFGADEGTQGEDIGTLWTLQRDESTARCALLVFAEGCELHVFVDGEPLLSQRCEVQHEVFESPNDGVPAWLNVDGTPTSAATATGPPPVAQVEGAAALNGSAALTLATLTI